MKAVFLEWSRAEAVGRTRNSVFTMSDASADIRLPDLAGRGYSKLIAVAELSPKFFDWVETSHRDGRVVLDFLDEPVRV